VDHRRAGGHLTRCCAPRRLVARLISVALLRSWLPRRSGSPQCSFCGRYAYPGTMLGGAAGGRICPDCVRVCCELVRDRAAAGDDAAGDGAEGWVWT
jgi:hypothetical protein